jgi:predicted small integral membrane protein
MWRPALMQPVVSQPGGSRSLLAILAAAIVLPVVLAAIVFPTPLYDTRELVAWGRHFPLITPVHPPMMPTMTWLAVVDPEVERVGVLRIPTTRGDRLFLSLILAAVIHLVWIALVGTDPLLTLPIGEGVEVSSLWLATLLSLASAVAIFRTV